MVEVARTKYLKFNINILGNPNAGKHIKYVSRFTKIHFHRLEDKTVFDRSTAGARSYIMIKT